MQPPVSEERWIELLAGRTQPNYPEEHLAARLRQALLEQIAKDSALTPEQDQRIARLRQALLEQIAKDSALTPEQDQRMLSALYARVDAYERNRQPGQFSPQRNRTFDFWRWWRSLTASTLLPWGAVAAVLLAVVLTPLMWQGASPSSDAEPKAVPSMEAAYAVVSSAQPDSDATHLSQVLQKQGVAAVMEPAGEDRLVRADIAPALRSAVAQALQNEGLALPGDGKLRLRFRKLP